MVSNVLNTCELAIVIIGTLVMMQDTLNSLLSAGDDAAHLSVRISDGNLMDGLLVSGWVTLVFSFAFIAYAILMDYILFAKQLRLKETIHRATALGASFSPKIFRMEHHSWLLPDWILQASDDQIKLVSAVESVVTAQSLMHKVVAYDAQQSAQAKARLTKYTLQAEADPWVVDWLLEEPGGRVKRTEALARLVEMEASSTQKSKDAVAGEVLHVEARALMLHWLGEQDVFSRSELSEMRGKLNGFVTEITEFESTRAETRKAKWDALTFAQTRAAI
eukprot:3009876-Prymnesium_polylepis.1